MFRNERCSVSWHADSTLEHYSTIAVYHSLFDLDSPVNNKKSQSDSEWRIALRVQHDAEGPNSGKRSQVIEIKTPPVQNSQLILPQYILA